ncbi:MAG: hypothetical protein JNL80_12135 [Phycisphaerae bacterium]|jgi:hypothetical protein|nr:hypothetical protein [Phycisphaerae bacterium]
MPHRDVIVSRRASDAQPPSPYGLALEFSKSERLLLCLRYADGLTDEEISVLTRTSVAEVHAALRALVERVRLALR